MNTQKRICYFGATLAAIGIPSFGDHPTIGYIVSGTGLVIVVTMKVLIWRNRVKLS